MLGNKRLKFILIASTLALILAGCGQTGARPLAPRTTFDNSPGPKPWTNLRFANRDDEFRFAIISDRTGSAREGIFEQAMDKLNWLHPEFVMCIGDLVQGYSDDAAEARRQRDELDGIVNRLDMPFFYVGGNHDLGTVTMREEWLRRYGRPYYHFIYRDVLFLVLNSETTFPNERSTHGRDKTIPPEEVQYVKDTLAKAGHVRWTMVFLHGPLWHPQYGDTNWAQIEALLANRPHSVFAGHEHQYLMTDRNGHHYITLATTGGASALTGPDDGLFDHIVWVTMTAKGPRLANLALEGILPEDFRTDETVALKKALGSPLSATPMIVQGETFAGDTTVLHLVNPSASAAHFTIDLQASARFSAEPAGLKADLAAGAQANFAVKLWPVNGPCEVNATPLLARWQARTETAAGKTIQTGGKFALGPAEARDCPARTSPVAVDGKLEEWPSLPWTVDKAIWGYNPEQNAGPTDLSYRFATAYDANYLYVAVDVTDDKVVALPGRPPWEQDCVQVYLEPAPTADGSLGRVIYLAASPAPAGSDAPLGANNSSTWPVGTRAAVARTDKGYAAEFAVPIVVLDQAQGGAWSRFRLNIGVEDQDGIGKHYHVKWQPKWEWTDRAVPGLGTFMRR